MAKEKMAKEKQNNTSGVSDQKPDPETDPSEIAAQVTENIVVGENENKRSQKRGPYKKKTDDDDENTVSTRKLKRPKKMKAAEFETMLKLATKFAAKRFGEHWLVDEDECHDLAEASADLWNEYLVAVGPLGAFGLAFGTYFATRLTVQFWDKIGIENLIGGSDASKTDEEKHFRE